MTSSPPLWRRVVDVAGVATELIGIAASNGPPQLQVLLIPGNPGSARFYTLQLRQLHDAMAGRADVLSVSHAGQDADDALSARNGHRLWSLTEQVAHKADVIRRYCLLPGRPPLVVAGHSIGAHMAVHAVAAVEADGRGLATEAALPPVLKVIALFPFFWIDRSQWKIRMLSVVAARYEMVGLLAAVLSTLPNFVRTLIVRAATRGTMDTWAASVTASLLTRHAMRNCMYMGHTEFVDLDRPPAWRALQALGRRLHVFGCPEDVWLSARQWSELQERLPGLQATWVPGVTHAYCASGDQCSIVTALMHPVLTEAVAHRKQWAADVAAHRLPAERTWMKGSHALNLNSVGTAASATLRTEEEDGAADGAAAGGDVSVALLVEAKSRL
ncbi:hypothetical protein FOA52_011350 [Chlamydomonas sp. UWO 241]|nr:hypothetical protein FOA52_011350 [Chlamydomonas sp. UWO 241]